MRVRQQIEMYLEGMKREEWAGEVILLPIGQRDVIVVDSNYEMSINYLTGSFAVDIARTLDLELKAYGISIPLSGRRYEWYDVLDLSSRFRHIDTDRRKKPKFVQALHILREAGASWSELKREKISTIRDLAMNELPTTGRLSITSYFAIHNGNLYTYEECKQEAIYIANRTRNEN